MINPDDGDVFEMLKKTFDQFGETLAKISQQLMEVFSKLDLNERQPWEEPVDWVLRVGAKRSGHNITPGEAWRFRANLDWWNGGKE